MPENNKKEVNNFEPIRLAVTPSGNAKILPDSSSNGQEDVIHNVLVLNTEEVSSPGEGDHGVSNTDVNKNILENQSTENIQNGTQVSDDDDKVMAVKLLKERLEQIDIRVEDISDKLNDLQEELSKGRLEAPVAERLGRPLRKLRKKLRDEKRTLLGVERLDDDDLYISDADS